MISEKYARLAKTLIAKVTSVIVLLRFDKSGHIDY